MYETKTFIYQIVDIIEGILLASFSTEAGAERFLKEEILNSLSYKSRTPKDFTIERVAIKEYR